jgi:hypothetical protein
MNILYVCHRFPFPPKRGGKIRPFNMIRHFTTAGHRVTVCSLARSADEAREGEGIAPHCAHYEMTMVSDLVQTWRMVAWLPMIGLSSMAFLPPDLKRTIDRLLASEVRPRAVHCSSVAQYVEHIQESRRSRFRRHGLAEVARVRHHKLLRVAGLPARGREDGARGEAPCRALDCARRRPAEWETLRVTA